MSLSFCLHPQTLLWPVSCRNEGRCDAPGVTTIPEINLHIITLYFYRNDTVIMTSLGHDTCAVMWRLGPGRNCFSRPNFAQQLHHLQLSSSASPLINVSVSRCRFPLRTVKRVVGVVQHVENGSYMLTTRRVGSSYPVMIVQFFGVVSSTSRASSQLISPKLNNSHHNSVSG